jgi:ceramide glucosyltransferase
LAAIVIAVVVAGSLVYCMLTIVAALRHLTQGSNSGRSHAVVRISVLKPLAGIDEGLRENLVSFFDQDYAAFELIFAVRHTTDPAYALATSLMERYPAIPCRLLLTGEPPYPNAKVYSLSMMTAAAAHDVLVMSDSDIRVERDFLRHIAVEIAADKYDLATCPYRAIGGNTIWSRLEALGMNTDFWGGVLVAKLVEGVRFTIGPTVVARRKVFEAIPWPSLSGYLAEDFVLGQRAAEMGFRVALSQFVVEHRLSGESMKKNLAHRLRWARSTRRSRPSGYVGQLFTYPVPLVLLLTAVDRHLWPVLAVTVVIRTLAAHAVAYRVLGAQLGSLEWLLMPVQDILGFLFWVVGFSGNHIDWRGHRYRLNRDGTFELVN